MQGPEHGPGEAVSECSIQEEHTAPHSHFPHPLLGRCSEQSATFVTTRGSKVHLAHGTLFLFCII